MSIILMNHEVRALALSIAREYPDRNCNDTYHKHIDAWAKSRGGAEVGSWNAWTEGWAAGLKLHLSGTAYT